MIINQSLTLPVNRQASATSGSSVKEKTDGPAPARPVDAVLSEHRNATPSGGVTTILHAVNGGRELIDLRVLRDRSLTLNSQLAISAYKTTSGISESSRNPALLDLQV